MAGYYFQWPSAKANENNEMTRIKWRPKWPEKHLEKLIMWQRRMLLAVYGVLLAACLSSYYAIRQLKAGG